MKIKITILVIILISICNVAFSFIHKTVNQGSSLPNDLKSMYRIYIAINGDIYEIDTSNSYASPTLININTKYDESSPSVSGDGNTLYFVSDRKGGYGGKDIWASERLSDGNWCKPYNLGSQINTGKDEDSPVISEDGLTLTFTSDGRNDKNENERYSSTMNDQGLWGLLEKPETYLN